MSLVVLDIELTDVKSNILITYCFNGIFILLRFIIFIERKCIILILQFIPFLQWFWSLLLRIEKYLWLFFQIFILTFIDFGIGINYLRWRRSHFSNFIRYHWSIFSIFSTKFIIFIAINTFLLWEFIIWRLIIIIIIISNLFIFKSANWIKSLSFMVCQLSLTTRFVF